MTNATHNTQTTTKTVGFPPTPSEAHQPAVIKSMKIVLGNGYPYPFPVLPAQQEAASEAAGGISLEIKGVNHFEWRHTLTVEFDSFEALQAAQVATGWEHWEGLVLEASVSVEDGYAHPAIIAGDWAYCGFMLIPD